MADFATIAPLLEDNRDVVVDALRRDQERRQKLAMRASSDPDTDANAVVRLLNESAGLDYIVRALNAAPVVTGQVQTEPTLSMPSSIGRSISASHPDLAAAAATTSGVPNVMQKLMAEQNAKNAPPPPPPAPDPEIPTKAWVLAPDAIAALIGDGDDPAPEDDRTPSANQSAAHGDQFIENFGIVPDAG